MLDRHLAAITTKRAQVRDLDRDRGVAEDGRAQRVDEDGRLPARPRPLRPRRPSRVGDAEPVDGLGRAERPTTAKNLKEIRVLDAVEVEVLLDAASTPRWKAALGLMALAVFGWAKMSALTLGRREPTSRSSLTLGHPGGRRLSSRDAAGTATCRSRPCSASFCCMAAGVTSCADDDLVIAHASGAARPVGQSSVRRAQARRRRRQGWRARSASPTLTASRVRAPPRAWRAQRDDAGPDPRPHQCIASRSDLLR